MNTFVMGIIELIIIIINIHVQKSDFKKLEVLGSEKKEFTITFYLTVLSLKETAAVQSIFRNVEMFRNR